MPGPEDYTRYRQPGADIGISSGFGFGLGIIPGFEISSGWRVNVGPLPGLPGGADVSIPVNVGILGGSPPARVKTTQLLVRRKFNLSNPIAVSKPPVSYIILYRKNHQKAPS